MSRLPFELTLALRYLRPKRRLVSVITLISVIGVMLGVAVLIIVIAVMSGFDQQLRGKLAAYTAHLRLEARDGLLTNYEPLLATVARHRSVQGVTPYVGGPVLLKTQPAEGSPAFHVPSVLGVDPHSEVPPVRTLLASVRAGTNDLAGYTFLVGENLALKLGLRVGDPVAIYAVSQFDRWQQSRETGSEEVPLADDFTVNGVFSVGFYDLDALLVVCSLANAQDLFAMENSVHGLIIALDDPGRAGEVAGELLATLGGGYQITTWYEEHASFLESVMVEKNLMYYLLFFITLVAAFGICSGLITFVVQKTREIGTLKALGATSAQIMAIFLGQSLVVGVLGVTAGFGLGVLGVTYRNAFLLFMRRWTGFELFPADIYHFYELPALIIPGDVLVIAGVSLAMCLLGGLIPAWHAGRLKPVEALRHE
jgi:lipoprotein-releasing system permease protein